MEIRKKADFVEVVETTSKRLDNTYGRPSINEMIYLLAKEIEGYRTKIKGYEKENEYLKERLEEEAAKATEQAPVININVGDIHVSNYQALSSSEDLVDNHTNGSCNECLFNSKIEHEALEEAISILENSDTECVIHYGKGKCINDCRNCFRNYLLKKSAERIENKHK